MHSYVYGERTQPEFEKNKISFALCCNCTECVFCFSKTAMQYYVLCTSVSIFCCFFHFSSFLFIHTYGWYESIFCFYLPLFFFFPEIHFSHILFVHLINRAHFGEYDKQSGQRTANGIRNEKNKIFIKNKRPEFIFKT